MPYLYAAMEEHPDIIAQTAMADGQMYTLPGFDYSNTNVDIGYPLYINQTWLDNLGLQTPNTTEEFYQVLKAFKEQDANGNGDPNDEIPYSFQGNNYNMFASFGVMENGSHLSQRDGKVYYTAIQPEYKEAIKYFSKLYSEGLIDPESFTQDGAMFNAKWKAGEDGSQERIVGAFQTWRTNRAPDYVPLLPLEGPTGIRAWEQRPIRVIRANMAITNEAKNPDLVVAWANQLYEPDYALQTQLGYKIGEHMELENGKFKLLRSPDLNTEPDKSMFMGDKISGVTKSSGDRMFIPPHIEEKQEIDKLYGQYIVDENMPNASFTQEEAQLIADYTLDISEYVKQMYAKWVMNGGIEKEWDGYVQKLKSMGVDEMVEIYQTAVDRYYELLK